jgi:hypothetical protein
MGIPKILRSRVYLALGLAYAISVLALCSHAPAVQRPIKVSQGEFKDEPAPPVGDAKASAQSPQSQDDLGFVPVAPKGAATPPEFSSRDVEPESNQPQSINTRAPVWMLGSKISLDGPLFAAEQAELIGLVLLVALVYRFRSRFMICGATIAAFIGSRRRGTCVWLGFAVVLLLAVFPPWVQIKTYGGRFPTQHVKLWHAPIFRAPVDATRSESSDVDYARMLMEIAVGECFVLALYLTWARTRPTLNSKG